MGEGGGWEWRDGGLIELTFDCNFAALIRDVSPNRGQEHKDLFLSFIRNTLTHMYTSVQTSAIHI